MRVASRFAIGVHILSLLGTDTKSTNTSEWMAGSIGVNPVIVRNVSRMLRRAGLVTAQQGVAGTRLAQPLSKITLLSVYQAVEAVEEGELFAFHPNPSPNCPVGSHLQTVLEGIFEEAQRAMEARLAAATMEQVVSQLRDAQSAQPEKELS